MIRSALPTELALFRGLWRRYLEETFEAGGDILPSRKTCAFFDSIFQAYTNLALDGVCLFADAHGIGPVGVLLWGEAGRPPFDTRFGRVAHGWGTFVQREYRRSGLSKALRNEAKTQLYSKGFSVVTGSVNTLSVEASESVYSLGFRPTHANVVWNLKEE